MKPIREPLGLNPDYCAARLDAVSRAILEVAAIAVAGKGESIERLDCHREDLVRELGPRR